VKEVLDYRIRMYGFGKKGRTASKDDGKARPGNDAARSIADKQQNRRKRIAARRSAAAAGTPGAGAITTRSPKVSKGADVETASKELLARLEKDGGGKSWGSTG
jgi:hypothetical protein